MPLAEEGARRPKWQKHLFAYRAAEGHCALRHLEKIELLLNVGEAVKDSPHGAETRALIRAVGHCLKMNVKEETIKINLGQSFTNGIGRHSTGLAKNVGGNESGFAQLKRLQSPYQLADGKFWKKDDHFAHFPSAQDAISGERINECAAGFCGLPGPLTLDARFVGADVLTCS